MLPLARLHSKYYVRLLTHDRPKVLASVANVLGDFDVSLESVEQRMMPDGEAELVLLTHSTLEQNMASALSVLRKLPVVGEVANSIRVEG
jgi:homoserine dehydrogenase